MNSAALDAAKLPDYRMVTFSCYVDKETLYSFYEIATHINRFFVSPGRRLVRPGHQWLVEPAGEWV